MTFAPRLADRRPRRPRRTAGLSMLEVLLALAILGGALVVIGQLVRIGARSAEATRDLTTAQILAESLMGEIVAGLIPAQTVSAAAVSDPQYQYQWQYSITVEPVDQEGLIAVWLRVEQTPEEQRARPVGFTLVRWMPDPLAASTSSTATSTSGPALGGL